MKKQLPTNLDRAKGLSKQDLAEALAALDVLKKKEIPALTSMLTEIENILTGKGSGKIKVDDTQRVPPAGRALHVTYKPSVLTGSEQVRQAKFPLEAIAAESMRKLNGGS